MEKIIEKYGFIYGKFLYSIDFGGNNSEIVVVKLIVCDGEQNGSDRETLLGTKLAEVGVAT